MFQGLQLFEDVFATPVEILVDPLNLLVGREVTRHHPRQEDELLLGHLVAVYIRFSAFVGLGVVDLAAGITGVVLDLRAELSDLLVDGLRAFHPQIHGPFDARVFVHLLGLLGGHVEHRAGLVLDDFASLGCATVGHVGSRTGCRERRAADGAAGELVQAV